MVAVDDPRNVDEKAENKECYSKACDPSDRPVLFPRSNVNITIGSTLLMGFGHPRQRSSGFELGGIEDLRL